MGKCYRKLSLQLLLKKLTVVVTTSILGPGKPGWWRRPDFLGSYWNRPLISNPNIKSIRGNFAEILSSPNSVGIARVFSDLLGYAFAHPVYWGIYLRAIQSLYLWEIHSIVAWFTPNLLCFFQKQSFDFCEKNGQAINQNCSATQPKVNVYSSSKSNSS